MKVLKFGGTSVGTVEALRNVKHIVENEQGQVVVVVSALGGLTDTLIKAAIDKDRERVYLGDLAATIWGNDYQSRARQLAEEDDNFRRIYKRLYPNGI